MYDTVVVPVDGSDESYVAAEEAIEITAPEGTLHALAVVEALPMHKQSGKGAKLEQKSDVTERERARASTEEVARLVTEVGIDAVTEVRSGVPAREILTYAEEVDADAVVLGKRGANESAQDMLGSTSQRVLKNASTTIVAVPGN